MGAIGYKVMPFQVGKDYKNRKALRSTGKLNFDFSDLNKIFLWIFNIEILPPT